MEDYGVEVVPTIEEILEDTNKATTVKIGDGISFFGTDSQRVSMFSDWAKYFMEVQNPVNDKLNTFFKAKYAPMDIVLEAIRPIMGKYGLTLIQTPFNDDDSVGIYSIVIHKDGGAMTFPALVGKATKPDIQGVGSAISYIRRYTATSIAGIIGSEEDDDGNVASEIQSDGKKSTKTSVKNEELAKARKECVEIIGKKIAEFNKGITDKDLQQKNRNIVVEEIKKFEPTEGNINLINDVSKVLEIKEAVFNLKGEN